MGEKKKGEVMIGRIKSHSGDRERHKLVPAVHLFLINGEKQILLLRRYRTGWQDGNYSVPAGHIEEGEPATRTMIREAKEETGIKIRPEDLTLCGFMHRRKKEEREERVDFFFITNKWQGKIEIGEPNKCDDLRWFPLDQLPDNIVLYVKEAIDNYKTGKLYSEFGWD